MVCLGNICRSPTAEYAVRAAAARAGVDVVVASCGTGGWHEGQGADGRTIKHAAKRGLDLSGHVARKLRADDFVAFDRLYAMDKKNLADLQALCPPAHREKVSLFLDDGDVPDPYLSGAASFERVLDLCEAAAARIIADLR